MGPADDTLLPLEHMLAAFREHLRAGSPFVDEREAAVDLSVEAAPVLEALLEAAHFEPGESDAMQQAHEALAMMTLLGRRAAIAGITPTAALALAPAVCVGLFAGGVEVTDAMRRTLTIVAMEGYAAGRDDLREARLREALVEAQRWSEIAAGVLLWAPAGPLEAAALGELSEAFGRALLRAEAVSCVVDVRGLGEADVDRARQIETACAAARTVGASCVMVVDAAWRATLSQVGVEASATALADDTPAAVRLALEYAGLTLRRPFWSRWLRLRRPQLSS